MNNNFDCGSRIRQLRNKMGISQEELALNAEITTPYLGMIERGEKNPTIRVIERLCNALNVTLSDFFCCGNVEKENDYTLLDEKILGITQLFSDEQKQVLLDIIHQIAKIKGMK